MSDNMQQLQKCGCCFLFTQTKQNGILIINKHMFGAGEDGKEN